MVGLCWRAAKEKKEKSVLLGGREAGVKERRGERFFSGSAEEREGTRLGGKRWVPEGLHLHAPRRDVRREDLRRGERFALTAEGRERFCRKSRGNGEERAFFFFFYGKCKRRGGEVLTRTLWGRARLLCKVLRGERRVGCVSGCWRCWKAGKGSAGSAEGR